MADFRNYINPVIAAINALGGSARPAEVYNHVAGALNLPDETLNEQKKSGGSRFENQVNWARFYLAKAGYIDASRHGVWSLTDKGQKIHQFTNAEISQLIKDVKALPSTSIAEEPTSSDIEPQPITTNAYASIDFPPPVEPTNYRDELLSIIQNLSPAGFERLCQRLLREAGFEEVTVIGRSGDGGIDGMGILKINPFVSFKVLFQSKRYSGTVSASQVRDFRGAMMGRADKGIIIATGTFTADAKREAIRDGVPPIELVDGDVLINMFQQLELGLRPRTTYDIDVSFFSEFK